MREWAGSTVIGLVLRSSSAAVANGCCAPGPHNAATAATVLLIATSATAHIAISWTADDLATEHRVSKK
jgi:hypothetical protein